MKRNRIPPSLKVTTGGRGVVSHAGARLLCDLADETGLTEALSVAMASTKQRRRGHDRGQVLVDLAVMLADGGKAISDLATLRNQPGLFGEVASTPTAWRTLEAVGPEQLVAIAGARAQARAAAWAAGADPGFYVMDFDGTLLNAHSEKESAAPTYKRGFGFHPLLVYLDGTGEALAGTLRPGNAASNTTADHVEVLEAALVQLPVDPHQVEVVARADSAALSHGFVDRCRERGVRFAIGHDLTDKIRQAVPAVPECLAARHHRRRQQERDGAEVAEITDLVDLSLWPEGTRAIARREDPHPGAQLTFTDIDGHRFQVFITDLADPDVTYLEALHRGRGRAEQRIRDGKDTGLRNLPSESFAINAAWLNLVLVAQDLLAWAGRLCLEGELARAEPKRLRYCLLQSPASSSAAAAAPGCGSPPAGRGPTNSPPPSVACGHCRSRPDPILATAQPAPTPWPNAPATPTCRHRPQPQPATRSAFTACPNRRQLQHHRRSSQKPSRSRLLKSPG